MGSTVTFSPVTSIMENKPAGTVVIGRPGSGKTYFLLTTAGNAILMKAKVIFIDFKDDSIALKNIDPNVRVTDINNIEPGAMNPFKMIKEIDTNALMTLIMCLCGDLSNQQINSVSPIVKDFIIQNRRNISGVSFQSLSNYLYASDNQEAQLVGTILKNHEDSRYGSIIFGEDTDTGAGIEITSDNVSQVISLLGMSIPGKDHAKWTQEDRFTSGIIYIITKMLSEVLVSDKSQPVVVIIDESHIMYANDSMAQLVDKLLVLGRSLNIAIVLSSQNMTHYPSDISQMIANKFMFASAPDQAREFLNRFDTSSEGEVGSLDRDSIVSFISNAKKEGICFMIDSKNRSGYVQIKSTLNVTSNPFKNKTSLSK